MSDLVLHSRQGGAMTEPAGRETTCKGYPDENALCAVCGRGEDAHVDPCCDWCNHPSTYACFCACHAGGQTPTSTTGETAALVSVDDCVRDRDGSLRGYGYYLALDYTGVEAVDRILAALHLASRAYHSTEGWNEEMPGQDDYSYSDLIQQAANEAAESFRASRG